MDTITLEPTRPKMGKIRVDGKDTDNDDSGVGGGGADRHSVVDGDVDGGAGKRWGDASKKTMATAMTMTRSKRKIFSDGKGGAF